MVIRVSMQSMYCVERTTKMNNERIVVLNEKMYDTKVQKVLRDLGEEFREMEMPLELTLLVGVQLSTALAILRTEFFGEVNNESISNKVSPDNI